MSTDLEYELTHADYVDQVDRLRALFLAVADLDAAHLRAHHDKIRALAPLDPAAWAKHGKRIQEELYLIHLAEQVADVVDAHLAPLDLNVAVEPAGEVTR